MNWCDNCFVFAKSEKQLITKAVRGTTHFVDGKAVHFEECPCCGLSCMKEITGVVVNG